jgi:hypothetical protein
MSRFFKRWRHLLVFLQDKFHVPVLIHFIEALRVTQGFRNNNKNGSSWHLYDNLR